MYLQPLNKTQNTWIENGDKEINNNSWSRANSKIIGNGRKLGELPRVPVGGKMFGQP